MVLAMALALAIGRKFVVVVCFLLPLLVQSCTVRTTNFLPTRLTPRTGYYYYYYYPYLTTMTSTVTMIGDEKGSVVVVVVVVVDDC